MRSDSERSKELLAKIANKPLDTSAVFGPMVGTLFDSISTEQLPKVLAGFSEPQKLVVMELLRAHRAGKNNPVPGAIAGS